MKHHNQCFHFRLELLNHVINQHLEFTVIARLYCSLQQNFLRLVVSIWFWMTWHFHQSRKTFWRFCSTFTLTYFMIFINTTHRENKLTIHLNTVINNNKLIFSHEQKQHQHHTYIYDEGRKHQGRIATQNWCDKCCRDRRPRTSGRFVGMLPWRNFENLRDLKRYFLHSETTLISRYMLWGNFNHG